MNLNDMAIEITKREGKRHSLNNGDVKEVLKIVCRMVFQNPKLLVNLYRNGEKQVGVKKKIAAKPKK